MCLTNIFARGKTSSQQLATGKDRDDDESDNYKQPIECQEAKCVRQNVKSGQRSLFSSRSKISGFASKVILKKNKHLLKELYSTTCACSKITPQCNAFVASEQQIAQSPAENDDEPENRHGDSTN